MWDGGMGCVRLWVCFLTPKQIELVQPDQPLSNSVAQTGLHKHTEKHILTRHHPALPVCLSVLFMSLRLFSVAARVCV